MRSNITSILKLHTASTGAYSTIVRGGGRDESNYEHLRADMAARTHGEGDVLPDLRERPRHVG